MFNRSLIGAAALGGDPVYGKCRRSGAGIFQVPGLERCVGAV